MIVNEDGSFYIEEGDPLPCICPLCQFPVPYDDALVAVTCTHCGCVGTIAEFTAELRHVTIN